MCDEENPQWVALGRLRSYVSTKHEDLGLSDTEYTCSARTPDVLSSAVNADDTWVSSLADDHATATKTEVQALDDSFTELLNAIDAKRVEVGQYKEEE